MFLGDILGIDYVETTANGFSNEFDGFRWRVLSIVVHRNNKIARGVMETGHNCVVFPKVSREEDVCDETGMAVPDGKTDIVGLVLGIIVDQNNL